MKPIIIFTIVLYVICSCGGQEKSERLKKPDNQIGLDNSNIIEIRYGSQFGMCEGYCYSEIICSKGSMYEITKAWGDTILLPTKIDNQKIQKAKWNELINSIDLNEFYSLKQIIGCPDCVDGGESWVEIKTNERTYRVSYEYDKVPNTLTLFPLGHILRVLNRIQQM